MPTFEDAVETLLAEKSIQTRWSPEDFWGAVASLIAAASTADDKEAFIASGLEVLRTDKPTLIIFPLANVSWDGPPIELDWFAIGTLNKDWEDLVRRKVIESSARGEQVLEEWLRESRRQNEELVKVGASTLVVAAVSTRATGMKASGEAFFRFDLLIALCLLLADQVSDFSFSGRGGFHNQPGARGDAMDRGGVTKALEGTPGTAELATTVSLIGVPFSYTSHQWYSAEPFPLSKALRQEAVHSNLALATSGASGIAERIRVGAQWFGKYHWEKEADSRVLALGVAFDSLLGSRAGLPGRAMSERFALLHDEAALRADAARRFNEYYSARSSIAHGSRSRKVDDGDFVAAMAEDVRWTARRLLKLSTEFAVQSDEQFEQFIADLRWGTRSW